MRSVGWFFIGFLLITYLFSCSPNERPNNNQSKLPDVLTEDVRQFISSKLKVSDSASINESCGYLDEVAEIYLKAQAWDSLYQVNRRLFFKAFEAQEFECSIPFFTKYIQEIPSGVDTIKAKLLELKGYCYYLLGENTKSTNSYQACAQIWENYHTSISLLNSYNMLGIIYNISGENEKAIEIYQTGLKASIDIKDTFLIAQYYDNLGSVYISVGKWRNGIECFSAANSLGISEPGKFLIRQARAYLEGDNTALAKKMALEGLAYVQADYENSEFYLTTIYLLIGEIYMAEKNYSKAIEYFQEAVEASTNEYPENHREIGKSYISLGEAYSKKDLSNLALQALQTGIKIFVPGFDPENNSEVPTLDLMSRETWMMVSLMFKGEVYEQRFNTEGTIQDLQIASNHYQTAVQFMDEIKLYYTESDSKQYWGDYSVPYVEAVVRTQLALYDFDKDENRLDTAFQLTQTVNAYLLRERLKEDEALELGNVPRDTIELVRNSRQAISDLKELLSTNENVSIQDSLSNQLFQLKRDFEKLNNHIVSNYPEYERIRYSIVPATIQEVQEDLTPDELLFKYFFGEEDLYYFSISDNSFQVYAVPADDKLIEEIRNYRRSISDMDYIRENSEIAEQEFLNSSQFLYQNLVAPALDDFNSDNQFSQLRIVPDGMIGYLVFDCFLQEQTSSWLDSELFLIQDYTISYHYSASLLNHKFTRQPSTKGFLGFGIEYNTETLEDLEVISQDTLANDSINSVLRGKKFNKLRYADDEVLAISKGLKGKTVLNKEASKSTFIELSPGYKLIHIAAHSFLSEEPGLSSAYLVFNQSKAKEDYLLSLSEVFELNLQADMVVLSACQTGTGELKRSEGVMSLARAFQIAGSNAVVASQWSISDQASATIMEEFYRQLKQGEPKASALRSAKLTYLSDDKLSSPAFRIPAYWAATVLIGNQESIALPEKWFYANRYLLIGLSILVIGFLFLRFNRK